MGMTDIVVVRYDNGFEVSRVIMNLKQIENLKKEVKKNQDEEFFTYTYISNKEYLVLVKLGMAEELAIEED